MTKLNKLAFKKIEDFDRNKLTGYTYNCPWNNDPQYTHLWNDLENLKNKKVARCGQPETRNCVHKVEYSIAGFRNTCPIAGRCGTYATPAPLRFSQFDFKGRGVKGKIQLNTVKFSFKHKNNGVDVANGREAKTWGGKFSKVKIVLKRYDKNKIITLDSKVIEKGPSINQYKTVAVNFNLDKIAKNISSKTQKTTFNNNRTLNLQQNDNFAIELHYYRVENTNPSVIRLKDANIDITFTYLDKPSIEISTSSKTINCSSKKVTHIIKTNSSDALKNLTYKSIPTGFSKPTVSTNKDNYTKTYVWTYNKSLTNTKKNITYQTTANNFKTEEKTTVTIKKNKIYEIIDNLTDSNIVDKKISTITSFIKGSEYNERTSYVTFEGLEKSNSLCYDRIVLHIKNKNQEEEFQFPYYGDDKIYQCQKSDSQNEIGMNICFYEQILNKLKCGEAKVTAEFIINSSTTEKVILPSIYVTTVPFSFKTEMTRIKVGETEEVIVDDPYHIRQPSTDEGDSIYEYYITFTREVTSDDPKNEDDSRFYKTAPKVTSIYNETQNDDVVTAQQNGYLYYDDEKIRFKINNNTVGTFKVGFYYTDVCNTIPNHVYHEFRISPEHKQYYDMLYIQEDESDFSYDNIVIREGDNNHVPIIISDIEEINSYNNIQICFNGGKTSISQMGFGSLTITNENDFTINNLAIELNPLIKDETTGEYDWINLWETIFVNFAQNIFAYNYNLKGRVEVIDNGEDVYLLFKELKPNDTISINIPFMSKDEGTYYVSLYINGFQLKRNGTNKFLPRLDRVCSKSDYAKFVVTDTMLLDLKINNYDEYINIDDYDYEYDADCNRKCDNDECTQCGPFNVLYSISNIDSISPISGEEYLVRIGYSPELKPIPLFDGEVYQIDTDDEPWEYPLPYAHVKIITNPHPDYEETPVTYTIKTDENGEGIFYYTIPSDELRTYNTESLRINNNFGIIYQGNTQNNPCSQGFCNETLIIDNNKFDTEIIIDEDFKQYKAGETVPINFQVIYKKTPYDNGLYIKLHEEPFVSDFQAGRTILLPISYSGTKKDPDQVLETSIETISDSLTENYVSKKIYCNIDTQVKVEASLAKTLVQQNEPNMLSILVKNGLKPNQKVKIRILTNGYDIKNINYVTNGSYSTTNTNPSNLKHNNLLYWDIGNMDSYEIDQISIDLQAQSNASGQKNICIKAFDYLHEEGDSNE